MATGQRTGDGDDEKENCLLSQSHGLQKYYCILGTSTAIFLLCGFDWAVDLQWERRCRSTVQAFFTSCCALLSWEGVQI